MTTPARRRRWIIAGVVVGALGAGMIAFAIAWSNRGAEPVATRDVVERYRSGSRGDESGGFLRPDAGVYRYVASGSERLSLGGTEQQWGPVMPATVRHRADGCWSLRIDFSTNHWRSQRYCPGIDALLDVGGTVFQRFDFVAFSATDTSVFSCDPPSVVIRVAAAPGDSWAASCTGRSTERSTRVESTGTNTFVGVEDLDVGGRVVPAYHYRLQRTLAGDQTGTEDTHEWYATATGLLLRATHDSRVASPSPFGDVVYTEVGEFRLRSTRPRR
ncbi:MAG: hypothetical protein ACKOA9_01900 [Actinomycetota bacterium]